MGVYAVEMMPSSGENNQQVGTANCERPAISFIIMNREIKYR
jgi:hypothetical protein